MNPFRFRATCDVCGGEGAADSRTAAAAWDARSFVAHTDPRECRDVLERKRREAARALVAPLPWKTP